MAKPKIDLGALDEDAGSKRRQRATEARTEPKAVSRSKDTQSGKPPSRVGKSLVGGYFPDDVVKAVKMIGLEEDLTIQQIVAEGLNHVFAARGKGEIADTEKAER